MSTPRTLEIPAGVEVADLETTRGRFAAHVMAARGFSKGHVLLIPGWTGSKEDFTPLLPLIASTGFDVIAYDQRGQFETSGSSTDDFSLGGFAADALSIARTHGAETTHLLGHSFGGLVAQRAALLDPDTWQSLSLLCSGPGALGEHAEAQFTALIKALSTMPMAQVYEEFQKVRPTIESPEINAWVRRKFVSNSAISLRAMTEALRSAGDRVDDLATLDMPFWVGRGEDDDAWPHDVQEDMAKRLGVDVTVIADSAHSPAIENPEATAEALLNFWRSFD